MNKMKLFPTAFFLLSGFMVHGQQLIMFKQVDTAKLFLEVYSPPAGKGHGVPRPAMLFFFGGGWINGNRSQFVHQAKYFADKGVVCFLADYRTHQKNRTSPFEALKDAKSAVRYLRQHASEFHIDRNRIIAAGGSAGGQLAAATALVDHYNDAADDLSISCIPNALVLFNPVIDNGPGGYGFDRIGEAYKEFSPLHNIHRGAPPTIILLGTNDKLVPVETARYYQLVMQKTDSRCELRLYEGQPHGFFNYQHREYYDKTLKEVEAFLVSLGMLE